MSKPAVNESSDDRLNLQCFLFTSCLEFNSQHYQVGYACLHCCPYPASMPLPIWFLLCGICAFSSLILLIFWRFIMLKPVEWDRCLSAVPLQFSEHIYVITLNRFFDNHSLTHVWAPQSPHQHLNHRHTPVPNPDSVHRKCVLND